MGGQFEEPSVVGLVLSLVKIAKNLQTRAARSQRWWVKRRGLSATYPARAHARPQHALLRVVQADPARLFIWCFADGDARTSNQSAARADSRTIGERIYREKTPRLSTRRARRVDWVVRASRGVFSLAFSPSRRARRDAATTYLRDPRPAPPTWCVGDPCRTPSPRTGWRGKVRVRTAFAPTRDATRVDARVPGRRACVERVAVSVTRAFESMRAIRAKRVKDVARVAKDARACGYGAHDEGPTVTRHFITPEINI